jgi:hypothetical protein
MRTIHSKVNPDIVLGMIAGRPDFFKERKDLTSPENFLQVALMRVNDGRSFKPHKHIDRDVTFKTTRAQECWVVLNGLIRADFYDIDDKLIQSHMVKEGGLVLSLAGGHTFECLEDHSFIIEFKSGPYEGQAKDKVFIDE